MAIDLNQIRVTVGPINPDMVNPLNADHHQHLLAEGFSEEHIWYMRGFRVASIDAEWSRKREIAIRDDDGKLHYPSGLYFPFTSDFGQIRVDGDIIKNGKRVKYMSCFLGGEKKNRTAGAWLPRFGLTKADRTEVITEGYKDAAAGTLIGEIATGAIAGVSHARKALERNGRQVILFDSDGWYNPSVFTQLCHAAKWVGGKVQLIPPIPNEPKAGLCEYFKSGYRARHYRDLIDSAMSIADFLFELPKRWKDLSAEQLRKCRKSILSLAVQYLDRADQDRLVTFLSHTFNVGKRALNADRDAFARKLNEKARREAKKAQKKQAQEKVELLQIPMKRDSYGNVEVPKAGVAAAVLEQKYRDRLAWHPGLQKFFRYESKTPGLWSEEPLEKVKGLIREELDASGAENQYDAAYISSVFNLMTYALVEDKESWEQSLHLLPFRNGILDVKTKEFLPHSPKNRLLYQIPHYYDPIAKECPKINNWLRFATKNDDSVILLLKCFVKAIIEGHPSLQKFLFLTGEARSGKGTFTRLIKAILGDQNAVSSSLAKLDKNDFEASRYYQKKLVIFEDADRYAGGFSEFKKLTGQDELICEKKNKDAFNFTYTGMVMLISNRPIYSGDPAIERREVIVPFDKTVQDKDRIDMDEELKPEISAFINECLEIPYEIMRATILQSATISTAMSDKAWEYRMRNDAVYDWMNEWLVFEKDATAVVGNDKADTSAIYGSYVQHCERTGSKARSLKDFSPYLLEALKGFNLGIEKKRLSHGTFFVNIRLKSPGEDIKSVIETVRERDRDIIKSNAGSVEIKRTSVKPDAESEPLQNKASGGSGQSETTFESEVNNIPEPEFKLETEPGKANHPHNPPLTSDSKGSDSTLLNSSENLPALPSPKSQKVLEENFKITIAQLQTEIENGDESDRVLWTELLKGLASKASTEAQELINFIQSLNLRGGKHYESESA